jgi:amidohydrolase
MKVKELAQRYEAYGIELRREFHMHPESSMKEYETQKRIMRELNALGLEGTAMGGTGVVAYIEGKNPGRTIGLRADIDALEVMEENQHGFVSKTPGLMHGCGHDGHTASLLMAAKILTDLKDTFSGKVKLIFQPGEETAHGALAMIKDGVMEDVDGIFGIHLWNDCETGKISAEAGPRMASAGIFKVYVNGKGGHGSMPHQGVDAGVVGASIVLNLQSIVSREINPLDSAVVSVGIFNSGTRFNVMPGEAYLEGTTRCFSLEVNDGFEEQITRIAQNTAESYRAEARVEYQQLVIPTINDEAMSRLVINSAKKTEGEGAIIDFEKTTGGEDFSYYGQHAPAAFAFVGCRKPNQKEYFPHHHPKFDIDEDALKVSGALYAQVAIDFLTGAHDD